jgi:hypothetical protein
VSTYNWYKTGRLIIYDGQLQISNDNNNWYQIFPTLGRVVEVIADDTNSSDDFKIAYLTPGQSLLVRNKQLFRGAITYPTFWRGELFYYKSGSYPAGILPNNTQGTDGSATTIYASSSTTSASSKSVSSLPYLTIANATYSGVFKSFSMQLIYYSSSLIHFVMSSYGMGVYYGSSTYKPDTEITFSKISFPTSGYFIGSFYYNNSTTTINYALFTRTM